MSEMLKTADYPYDAGDLQTLIENNGSGNPLYIGKARPSITSSETGWQIRKLTYDGSDNVLSVKFANGKNGYSFIWDDRATYTY